MEADRFFVTGDLNVERGIISAEKEFVGLFGPDCWLCRTTALVNNGKNRICWRNSVVAWLSCDCHLEDVDTREGWAGRSGNRWTTLLLRKWMT